MNDKYNFYKENPSKREATRAVRVLIALMQNGKLGITGDGRIVSTDDTEECIKLKKSPALGIGVNPTQIKKDPFAADFQIVKIETDEVVDSSTSYSDILATYNTEYSKFVGIDNLPLYAIRPVVKE